MLYGSKINSIIGPSEQGKSWLALLACLQAIRDGKRVSYVDFESDGPSIGGRLKQMGASDRELALLHYVQPDERYTPHDIYSDLAIVDGLNAFYGLHGVDANNTVEVTQFNRLVFVPWAASGTCVAIVDHTPKNTQPGQGQGAIGSQAKRAVITGASLKVKMTEAFGRSRLGNATVYVDKDRCGHVRGLQEEDGSVAQLTVDDRNGTKVELGPSPWVRKEQGKQDREMTQLQAVARALAEGPMSGTALAGACGYESSQHSSFRSMVERLTQTNVIRLERQGKSVMHHLV